MFTDTKNILNNSNQFGSSSKLPLSHKSKGTLKRTVRLIFKLMSSPKFQNNNITVHPNNVNLNNSPIYIKDTNISAKPTLEDLSFQSTPTSSNEQFSQPLIKGDSTNSEDCEIPTSETIIKQEPSACTGCIHGVNCQQHQFHHDASNSHLPSSMLENTISKIYIVRTVDDICFLAKAFDKSFEELKCPVLCY